MFGQNMFLHCNLVIPPLCYTDVHFNLIGSYNFCLGRPVVLQKLQNFTNLLSAQSIIIIIIRISSFCGKFVRILLLMQQYGLSKIKH
jgi:hypothetical protein